MASIFSLLNRFNIVKQIPLFSKLSWLEIRRIARRVIVEEYTKGEFIRRQGDPADYFYCLISGRLEAYTLNSHGFKDHVEFIHRGMYFGIISTFTGESHSHNYEALNDSIILKIPREEFNVVLKTIPSLAIEFNQILSKRVRSQMQGHRSTFDSTIISVYSPVKDTGSSTYAVNLALSLTKETGKKVILVKLYAAGANGSDGPELPVKGDKPPIQLSDLMEDHEKIFNNILKDIFGIDFLSVVFDVKEQSFKKMVSPMVSILVRDYYYVIVDLPNDMDDFVLETLMQSDNVHLMTLDRRKDLELTRHVIDRLSLSFKERFKEEKIRVILRSQEDKTYLSYEEINKVIDFNVSTMLPHLPSEDFIKEEHYGYTFYRCSDKSQYYKTITRIARQIGGVMVGLVLGGGAALGVAHVGVIRVLEEENIPIDIVVGSSMGALIASIWVIGKNSYDLEKVAREFENPRDMLKLFDPVVPIKGLIGGNAITRWLRGHLGDATFFNTRIPIKIVAYDLVRREELIIDHGFLVDAVHKSIAIPGVLEPIESTDQWIIDGGVLNPLPTNVLTMQGIKKIIAVNVLQSPEDVAQGFDMLQHRLREEAGISFLKHPVKYTLFRCMRTFSKLFNPNISDIIVRTLQATEYVIAQQSAKQANVIIHPDLVGINWFELNKVNELIKGGMDATRKHLPEIKKLIES